MTQDVNDLLNAGVETHDDGIKHDQYGRYRLADPETGEIKPWTRVTTLSGCLDDSTALETWKLRNLAYGLGRREDLFAMAASVATLSAYEDKRTLDSVIHAAKEAAGEPAKSNLGTALHGFTQRLDLGEKGIDVPSQWKGDVAAYLSEMKRRSMWPYEQFIERVVLIPELETAGTVDRLLMGDAWTSPRVGDLKTGKVEGKGRAFAMQLAAYAHATYWYDPKTNTYHEMPTIDRERGVILHLPVGKGTCTCYEVDLVAGWEAVRLAHDVHQWRKRTDVSWSMDTPPAQQSDDTADGALLEDRITWIRSRVEWLVGEGHGQALAEVWNQHCPSVPTFHNGGPKTLGDVDALASACALVEKAKQLPFFKPDPTNVTSTNTNTIKELALL